LKLGEQAAAAAGTATVAVAAKVQAEALEDM
jgi:hypothetical protein